MSNDILFETFDREGKPISDDAYHRLFRDMSYKVVEKTVVGKGRPWEAEVSTVWLGLNHAYDPSHPPIIFETLVFGGPLDQDGTRYTTEAEARAGHAEFVRKASAPALRYRWTMARWLRKMADRVMRTR